MENEVAHSVIINGLKALQHRGQDSAGIATGVRGISKEMVKGLASNFADEKINELKSAVGIGHVRYCTAGSPGLKDAQPVVVYTGKGRTLAIAFNGNVVNARALRKSVHKTGHEFISDADGEVLAALIASYIKDGNEMEYALTKMMQKVDGGYSMVVLTSNRELYAVRDPHGLRPLSMGKFYGSWKNKIQKCDLKWKTGRDGEPVLEDRDSYPDGDVTGVMFASESVAIDANGAAHWKHLNPGEMISVKRNPGGLEIDSKIIGEAKPAHCLFEFVYFMRADSIGDGERPISSVRYELGRQLAIEYGRWTPETKPDIIVPVPDTARTAAEGINAVTGIPIREGLMKNRYSPRTFIMPTQEERDKNVDLKLNPISAVVKGKNILLVDDSIVRGTTMHNIIVKLRKAGARRVEMWSTCPPIVSPCFYGIDMPNHKELVAANNSVEEIGRAIGADMLRYQTEKGLETAIGLDGKLCKGCISGTYPTQQAQRIAVDIRLRGGSGARRYTERANGKKAVPVPA